VIDEAKYWLSYYQEKLEKIPEQAQGKKGMKRFRIQYKLETLNLLLSDHDIKFGRLIKFLRKYRKEELKDSLNQGYRGLLDCYYKGFVKIVNGPGCDFIGDKLFCTFMDKLITYYLKEEPILKTIPTLSFAKEEETTDEQINENLLNQVFDIPAIQDYVVVKRVDGRGGDAVWVGPKIPREEFIKVKELVRKEPEAFLVQKYIALSQVDGQLVDI